NISKFFEVLHDLKITIPIELMISHWDKHDRTRSLNKFVEQEMPNTYSWLSTEEFKDACTFNFSIYSKKDSTQFDTSNNTYIKQFVNRLWENIYQKRQNVFDTGAVDVEKQEELKKKHQELNTLFTDERIKEVFGILLKSKLPEDDIDKLMILENNWLNIENLENMDLVLSDKSIKKKSFIQNELFKYINEV
ncbi:MAG: hypothetical protein GY756_15400, partial [bacterium]|nr:hypothetical protein [bacterium]